MKKIISLAVLLFALGVWAHPTPSLAAEQPFDVGKAIAAGDHKGLADYYKAQADLYRKKAEEHDAMMADYKKGHAYYKGMENSFQAHCEKLKKDALSMAEKYNAMAAEEEKLIKKK